ALLLRCGETMDRDRIAGSAEPALEAPWLALHPIHLRVEAKVVARLHDLLAAEPAAEAAGAARVRPQRVALDQQRIFGLDLLGGTVVSVAVVHGDGRVAAVAVVLGAPAAADQPAEIDVETVVLRAAAIDAADDEIGVVTGDDALGDRRGERLEDGVDDGHGIGHPHAHRGGLERAHYAPRRQHDFERAELAVVDGKIERRGQALERHLAAGAARGLAGIVEAGDLLCDIGEIDLHAVARVLHALADRPPLAELDAVVVHERLGFIDAIGNLAPARARSRLAVIHDRFDAADHGVAAVFVDHFEEAPLAGLDRRDLGAEVT